MASLDINFHDGLDEKILQLQVLINQMDAIADKTTVLQFISPKEFAKMYGCSERVARELFQTTEFPASDFGKGMKAEVHAVLDYFKRRRSKDHVFAPLIPTKNMPDIYKKKSNRGPKPNCC